MESGVQSGEAGLSWATPGRVRSRGSSEVNAQGGAWAGEGQRSNCVATGFGYIGRSHATGPWGTRLFRRPCYRSASSPNRERNMAILGVIPARFASTRLPGKPLLSDTGKPLIQHVVDAAKRSTLLTRIIVATDDQRIFDAVTSFGGEAMMTREDHPSGTDRVAEVLSLIHI